VHSHEVVLTAPTHREPRGVVFMLHGCLQLVTEWGFQSEHCPDCHGAPRRGCQRRKLCQEAPRGDCYEQGTARRRRSQPARGLLTRARARARAPGMPEEMVTVWKMWRRGYAVAAVGPLDGGGGYHCYATGVDAEEFDVPEAPEVRPARLAPHPRLPLRLARRRVRGRRRWCARYGPS